MKPTLVLAFIGIFGLLNAQPINYGPQPADLSAFPTTWEGRWEGVLRIEFPGVRPRLVPMAIEILPIDSTHWHWTLIYDVKGQEDRRAYTLEPVHVRQGHWQIDENNGIVLGARLFGHHLFTQFEVEGQMLMARYSLEGDSLRFEITSASLEPHATGGPTGEDPQIEAIPEVKWYEVGVFQQAILRRKD